jgi:hypothetical protein
MHGFFIYNTEGLNKEKGMKYEKV